MTAASHAFDAMTYLHFVRYQYLFYPFAPSRRITYKFRKKPQSRLSTASGRLYRGSIIIYLITSARFDERLSIDLIIDDFIEAELIHDSAITLFKLPDL